MRGKLKLARVGYSGACFVRFTSNFRNVFSDVDRSWKSRDSLFLKSEKFIPHFPCDFCTLSVLSISRTTRLELSFCRRLKFVQNQAERKTERERERERKGRRERQRGEGQRERFCHFAKLCRYVNVYPPNLSYM